MLEGSFMHSSTVTKKFQYLRCARIGLWQGATKEHSHQGSVTEEQRSQKPILAQPSGWPAFLPLPSLLSPCRPPKGMLVARASAAPKIPGHAGVEIYLSQYCSAFFNRPRARKARTRTVTAVQPVSALISFTLRSSISSNVSTN